MQSSGSGRNVPVFKFAHDGGAVLVVVVLYVDEDTAGVDSDIVGVKNVVFVVRPVVPSVEEVTARVESIVVDCSPGFSAVVVVLAIFVVETIETVVSLALGDVPSETIVTSVVSVEKFVVSLLLGDVLVDSSVGFEFVEDGLGNSVLLSAISELVVSSVDSFVKSLIVLLVVPEVVETVSVLLQSFSEVVESEEIVVVV